MVVTRTPPFAKKVIQALRVFDGGLNDKFSPLQIDDKEVAAIQNFNFDEKGALTKRKGYLKHYVANFAAGPTRCATNYRKQDGTSRLVLAADDKLFSDNPQFIRTYTLQADWELGGTERDRVDTATTADAITPLNGTLSALGRMGLGGRGASGGGVMVRPQAIWRSQTLDITAVTDKTTGKVASSLTAPTGTTVVVETRVSPDQTAWDAWLALGVGDTIEAVGTRNYLQVRIRMNSTSGLKASATSAVVTFDITPAVVQFASGLSSSARYIFAIQNDILYIFNGVDTNKNWDGTTYGTQGGSPPTSKYAMVHKNYMFLAGNSTNPSRLYFSDLADPETWPVLNFIDIGKGDGDTLTGLAVLMDRLVITKQNSVWLLEGDAPANFVLRRVADTAGCVDQHSIVTVENTLGMLGRDGYYFFDGVRMVLASEKISTTFEGLNRGQFALVAAEHFPAIRKVLVSLPSGVLTQNDTVLVFDTLRAAWTVYKGIRAASWVTWRQFNVDHLLFGDATVGQVHDAETGYSDNGLEIACYATSKALELGGTELSKFLIDNFITAKETSGTGDATINVSFFKNLNTTESAATPVTVAGAEVNVNRVGPAMVGAGTVRDIAVKVAESSANRSVTIYGIVLEFTPRLGLRIT